MAPGTKSALPLTYFSKNFTRRLAMWNTLPPDIVNFNSLSSFKHSVKLVNFSGFLKCF